LYATKMSTEGFMKAEKLWRALYVMALAAPFQSSDAQFAWLGDWCCKRASAVVQSVYPFLVKLYLPYLSMHFYDRPSC
jgi:hypothetical protein